MVKNLHSLIYILFKPQQIYIKLQYSISQSHQKHFLIVAKLKNTTCIREDANARCINSVPTG